MEGDTGVFRYSDCSAARWTVWAHIWARKSSKCLLRMDSAIAILLSMRVAWLIACPGSHLRLISAPWKGPGRWGLPTSDQIKGKVATWGGKGGTFVQCRTDEERWWCWWLIESSCLGLVLLSTGLKKQWEDKPVTLFTSLLYKSSLIQTRTSS